MKDIHKKIDNYIELHSKPEDALLNELNRQTHLKIMMPRMLSGQIQGKLLETICLMMRPRRVLEIGTYTGYSAICMAKGMPEGAILHTFEIKDELENFIRKYIKKSGFENKIELHIGDALVGIPLLNESFDLAFIDADKRRYIDYYEAILPQLRKGGFILADNVLWNNKVIQTVKQNDYYTKAIMEFNEFVVQDTRVDNFILPLRDGISIIRKK